MQPSDTVSTPVALPTKGQFRKRPLVIYAEQMDQAFSVLTLEGVMTGNLGDYLITGVLGEQYPCRKDVFEASYEPAEETAMEKFDIEAALDDVASLADFFEEQAQDRGRGGREYALARTKLQEALFWANEGHDLRGNVEDTGQGE